MIAWRGGRGFPNALLLLGTRVIRIVTKGDQVGGGSDCRPLQAPAIIRQLIMDRLIETESLTKRFGQITAVEDVSLQVGEGQILALLGPNGAGKTTTIRMLASILRPTEGSARIAGFDVREEPEEVRRRVGLLTEHHGLYTRMRAADYLEFFGRAYGLNSADLGNRISDLLESFGLDDAQELRLGQYSRGMQQKLALARALLHDPSVLLLDEPTSAMDPASAKLVRRRIVHLRGSRRAVVVCTHNLAEAETLADQLAIIHQGRIIAQGPPHELKRRLLGDPIMELRLGGPPNGAVEALPGELVMVSSGRTWLRYRTARPDRDNPRVLRAMDSAGVDVITLSEVGRSLEDVYLRVVGADEVVEDSQS